MEARALLALDTMGDSRYGAELMIREILAKQPDHPGAHHYRIHNWDYHEPEQALDSAKRYGEIVYWDRPCAAHAGAYLSASSGCGTKRQFPWTRPRGAKKNTCRIA